MFLSDKEFLIDNYKLLEELSHPNLNRLKKAYIFFLIIGYIGLLICISINILTNFAKKFILKVSLLCKYFLIPFFIINIIIGTIIFDIYLFQYKKQLNNIQKKITYTNDELLKYYTLIKKINC